MSTTSGTLNTCGCEPPAPEAPVTNRPGLPAVAFRAGTHPTFLRRMLGQLPVYTAPDGTRPLAGLTTRGPDDPAIALLDAWAVSAHVLAFYNERILNETYLRTATERRSILELARAIGYELRPGVAAGAFLAFTVDDPLAVPGVPATSPVSLVPTGTRVQSVPEAGQLPQTFETSADITARAEWNALRPRTTRPQDLAVWENKLYLLGVSTHFPDSASPVTIAAADLAGVFPLDPAITLPEGEPLTAVLAEQVYLSGTDTFVKAGDPVLFVGRREDGVRAVVKTVVRVVPEPDAKRTRIDLGDKPKLPLFLIRSFLYATVTLAKLDFVAANVAPRVRGVAWRERDLRAFLSVQGWSSRRFLTFVNTPPRDPLPPDAGAFGFRTHVGFFGHNAPKHAALPKPDNTIGNPYPNSWDGASARNIWTDSQGTPYPAPTDVYLERSVPEAVRGTWAVFTTAGAETAYRVGAAADASIADYALTAKATGLELLQADGATAPVKSGFPVRKTTAHVGSERLALAQLPITEPVPQGTTQLSLDRMVLGLQPGRPVVLTGEREDLAGVTASEVLELAESTLAGGFTVLTFVTGTRHPYLRDTLVLNANVARATHGESVTEPLGGGDGARANQEFELRKPPLTHVSAPTPSGGESTLRVRVNGVLWKQVPALFDLGPSDECFAVRIDDGGKARIVFGDGVRGARLPTGATNVAARYRSGIGLSGMVGADKLSLVQTRPLGIRGVTNPLPASGAADPESRDSARGNAPLTVLTLDRIVSLRDCEDFARAFAGVGKAQAAERWDDRGRVVHVTVAASAPAPSADPEDGPAALANHVIDEGSDLFGNLTDAMNAAKDPGLRFRVASYLPLFFNVKARLLVDPRFDTLAVRAEVEAAVKAAFSFDRRAFGQSVTAAEVIAVLHRVTGVVAADLDQLYRYTEEMPPPPNAEVVYEVLSARPVGTPVDRVGLLLVNPIGIVLGEMLP